MPTLPLTTPMTPQRLLATLALLVAPVLGASAHTQTVGRTDIDLSGQPWVELTSYASELRFDGGIKVVPVDHKVYMLPGEGAEPRALLVISNTTGSVGSRVRWVSEMCPPARPMFHTDDFGTNQQIKVRRCLVVNASFVPSLFFQPGSEVPTALAAKGLSLFKTGYSIRSVFGSTSGEVLRVNLVTRRGFTGLPGASPVAQGTHDVAAPLVAWGEALQRATEAAVMSLPRSLTLPPASF